MANSYLTHTQSAGNRRTWTFSAWIKFSNVSDVQRIFLAHNNTHPSTQIDYNGSKIAVYNYDGSNTNFIVQTNRLFRDVNGWYHLVVAVDTTQATASDRVKLYINGVQETSLAQSSYPSQNYDTEVNDNGAIAQVSGGGTPGNSFDGYMSHVALVDGQALAPTVFGSTDSTTGQWKFKNPTGVTWGTNGFHLKFENSGALGTDSSGQSNTFTVNGNLRQSLDTPSNVYATTNPNSTGNFKQSTNPNLASNGNTTLIENGGQHKQAPTTLAADTGKWYCEVKATSGTNGFFGACSTSLSANLGDNYSYPGNGTTGSGVSIRRSNGEKSVGGSESTYGGSAISNGDIIGIALDLTNQKIYFSKNGQWSNGSSWNSSTFDAAVGAISLPSGAGTSFDAFYQFSFSPYNSGCDINFGNGYFGTTAITSAGSNGNGSLFEYDVPSGYYALNTKNINTYG